MTLPKEPTPSIFYPENKAEDSYETLVSATLYGVIS
jgi:hypothetical protein